MRFTKETTLDKVVEVKGAEEVLAKHGVPCVSCPMAKMEMGFLRLGDVCERSSKSFVPDLCQLQVKTTQNN